MSVSKDEVVAAYRAILGREPEGELVVEGHTRSESLEELLKSFVESEEFTARMRFTYEKYSSDAPAQKHLTHGELAAWEQAARLSRNSVDHNRGDGDAWMRYGRALKELAQFDLAESAYRRAIELKNEDPDAYIQLGDVLNRLDRSAEAQKMYIAAYRLDPNSRVAAARLRTLTPEIASHAFDVSHASDLDRQVDDPAQPLGTERLEWMTARGLPIRRKQKEETSCAEPPSERRSFERVPRALALISTRNFLPFARLTAETFRLHHPEFEIFLLLVDEQDGNDPEIGEGHIIRLRDIDLAHPGWYAAKFTASEFANALKPSFLKYLSCFADKAIYLDCDIAVFSRLTELVTAMESQDLVLIPHMLTPLPKPEHYHTHPTRADIFNSGLVNAGCFAIDLAKTGEFLDFWETAVLEPGAFFDEAGYQTDQQYLNWALIKVRNTGLIRDDRYNVAYWNLHERDLCVMTVDQTRQFMVGGRPLGFFHFSGYDIDDRLTLSRHDARSQVYNLPAVAEILNWYSEQIFASPLAKLLGEPYRYDYLANGFFLSPFVRRLLKRHERFAPKIELGSAEDADSLCAFLMDPLPATASFLPLALAEIYDNRPDLGAQWPGAHTTIAPDELRWWFFRHAGDEYPIQFLIDQFRRSLVSDSSFGFAKQIATLPGLGGLRFLGEERGTAARKLRAAGEPGMAQTLLETRTEWIYFSDLEAAFAIYENRPDLQSLFPDIYWDDLDAFSNWLDRRAPQIHGCQTGLGQRLKRCGRGASLARIYSFLARREDVARRSQDSLLTDNPEPVFRELIRAAGDGMEFDVDDVVVFRRLHRARRHLLVPLYLELPLVRERPESSRVAGKNLAVLPDSVRHSPWALRGAEIHAALFDPVEARIDDELRHSDPTRPREVSEWLRTSWRQSDSHGAGASLHNRSSVRVAGLGKFVASDLALRPNAQSHKHAVNVFGFFASDIGVGESSRGLACAISLVRPVNRVPTWTGQVREGTELSSLFQRFDHLADTNVFVSYPHQVEDILGRLRREHFSGRRNVAHLAWEQKDANPWWRTVYDRYDEIWAISDFAATAFWEFFPGRVRVVPNVLAFDEFPVRPETMEARLTREQIQFLFVFDANSSIERKNPEAVLAAFERAFKDTPLAPHVRLTLKVAGMHRTDHAERVERLMRRAAATGLTITFDGRQLSRSELLGMVAEADCYVSLHHAEGFGYTMAEAMFYGVPVIASGYSGNLQYMSTDNSFLVPCKEVFVKTADGPFQRGSMWGDPDIDVAAELMRRAVEDRSTFRDVGRRGRETVIRTLSATSVAETIRPFFDTPPTTTRLGIETDSHPNAQSPGGDIHRDRATWRTRAGQSQTLQ
jgi:glycosyltransferase involved in cell wall biosynthesis/tetratricopeptide (TPR) repeat protein